MKSVARTLFHGIGNPLRGDDGLGLRFIEEMLAQSKDSTAAAAFSNVDFHWSQQLTVEDSALWIEYEKVIVVDAWIANSALRLSNDIDFIFCGSKQARQNYFYGSVTEFGSHSVSPWDLEALCLKCFKRRAEISFLLLKSSSFEMEEGLSAVAERSLSFACVKMLRYFQNETNKLDQSHSHDPLTKA